MPEKPVYRALPIDVACPRCHQMSICAYPADSAPLGQEKPSELTTPDADVPTQWIVNCVVLSCQFRPIVVGEMTIPELAKAIASQAEPAIRL